MYKNPYEVLGVPENASDDEIKRAYREMTRKYHPDANINNPLADLAEEKFKEVQEAYNVIMRDRENAGAEGGYSYRSSNNGYNSNTQYDDYNASAQFQTIYRYINAAQYREAIQMLSNIQNRTAEWYYLSAAANAGIGNNILARDHIKRAVNMNPANQQYRELMNRLEWNNRQYQASPYGGGFGNNNNSCSTGNICCDLWCADSLCECMGGDLCSCI